MRIEITAKHLYLIVLSAFCATSGNSQSALSSYLKGNSAQYYSSPSIVNFNHTGGDPVYISEVVDNRKSFWNKMVEENIKVEMIRDFWSYPYKSILKNKISEDLSRKSIKIDFQQAENQYIIEPQVDVHYPNLVSSPKRGFPVYTRIKMKVTKEGKNLLEKTYSDYYLFSEDHEEFKQEYLTNFTQATSVAMWIGMTRALDQFYSDLNLIFWGKPIEQTSPSTEEKQE